MLSDVNQLVFDPPALEVFRHPATTDEIKSCCEDLKLLGKLDFKNLLKWRTEILRNKLFQKKVRGTPPCYYWIGRPGNAVPCRSQDALP